MVARRKGFIRSSEIGRGRETQNQSELKEGWRRRKEKRVARGEGNLEPPHIPNVNFKSLNSSRTTSSFSSFSSFSFSSFIFMGNESDEKRGEGKKQKGAGTRDNGV